MEHFALLKFYGVDWLAMILMFSSIYALGLKRRNGFLFGAAGCVCWIAFGFMVGSFADITANSSVLVMNFLGYRRWSRQSMQR